MEKLSAHLKPQGRELFRSISSPACSTRDVIDQSLISSQEKGYINDHISIDSRHQGNQEQLTLAGIQENEEAEGEEPRTPDPVSKLGRDSIRQMITGIDTPPLPSSFAFGGQRKNAFGDVFASSDRSNEAAVSSVELESVFNFILCYISFHSVSMLNLCDC